MLKLTPMPTPLFPPIRRPLLLLLASVALSLLAFPLLPAAVRGQGPVTPVLSIPRLTHPGSGQIFYFVLTDRFANGSTANDTGGIAGGPDQSGFDPTKISHYHGGDFVGLTSKLDYIKGLGATAIWITPPFRNKPMQDGTAGYHGYWILDFTQIDPHLGTDAEFRDFIQQAHDRGLKVYLDIVVNHTADVIHFKDGGTDYRTLADSPYRDRDGKPFDPHAVAYNGLGSTTDFPVLSPERSFPHIPFVTAAEAQAKAPEWLNDVTLYHNRGNSHFSVENSLYGDFGGLDDLFTENPAVVQGFIKIYSDWMEQYGIDGYRIDTVKHVNLEFWQAFAPAIREKARTLGRPGFLQFGEVANDNEDVALMSEFSTAGTLDGTIDFGFFQGALDFVSRGGNSANLHALFERDDWYTDHDSNVQNETTFVSNHDAGRLAYFLRHDNPRATPVQLGQLVLLGHALLLTARGQPALYYGDEQGMVGLGEDMGAREDMFASQAPRFRALDLLGVARRGGEDKFDPDHPFYRAIQSLAALRIQSPGLAHGAMILRESNHPHLFAFSRIEHTERVEYLVALNNSRTEVANAILATSQKSGSAFGPVFDTRAAIPGGPDLKVGDHGQVAISLAPLQGRVWKARQALSSTGSPVEIRLTDPAPGSVLAFTDRSVDGHDFPVRREISAEVSGGDGLAEVTFTLARRSRPGQFEYLGTADRPPYRIFWRPPADLAAGDELTFIATVDDLRDQQAATSVKAIRIAPSPLQFGIKGATVPLLTREPASLVGVSAGSDLSLEVEATGTPPLEYRWLHDGLEIPGATSPILTVAKASGDASGLYLVLVHSREGTTTSHPIKVRVGR